MPGIANAVHRVANICLVFTKHVAISIAAVLTSLLIVIALLYASAPWYNLAPAYPFQGALWYNPYDSLGANPERWLQANFHAHSRAWGGATNGRQEPQAVVGAYQRLGYDVIGLSNYHEIPNDEKANAAFPVFEHGWNVQKSHRLALGARRVVWRDYPLGQVMQHKQDIITRLRDAGALVVIAHPAMRNGHSIKDFTRLTGYDALEVLNHFLPPAEAQWDAALSSARPVWVMANDDSHDITETGETGVHWTLVHAPSSRTSDITDAIRRGRTIGVRGRGGRTSLHFYGQRMYGDTLEVRVGGAVRRVSFTGQGGAVRREVTTHALVRHGDTLIARAVAQPDDGYLRAVVVGEQPDANHALGSALFLNPVVRWDGRTLGASQATVHAGYTALMRIVLTMMALFIAATSLRFRVRRRAPIPAPKPA